jgi:hypothetical protein
MVGLGLGGRVEVNGTVAHLGDVAVSGLDEKCVLSGNQGLVVDWRGVDGKRS